LKIHGSDHIPSSSLTKQKWSSFPKMQKLCFQYFVHRNNYPQSLEFLSEAQRTAGEM